MKPGKSIFLIAYMVCAALTAKSQDIVEAVKTRDLAKVKSLVENDPLVVHSKDDAGNTPLHHAAISGTFEMAEFLISKEADINAQNAQLNTPLHEAIQSRNESICKLLIERGASIEIVNIGKQTPLHRAASSNQRSITDMLIARGAAIDPFDAYGRTPFLLVARNNGNVEIGKLLLDKGADVQVKDQDNQMALNLAAWKGYKDFIDFLLDHNAAYDTTRNGAQIILSEAARCGHNRLFKVVLDKENQILSDENFNRYIMLSAISGSSVEIVKMLLERKIPVNNEANSYGWTPVHYAAANGHENMFRFLYENHLDINARTLSGKSAFNIAEAAGMTDVLKTIREINGDTSPERFPQLSGLYLGQVPPKDLPVLFAPDIVSSASGDDNHGSVTFSPDGNEIYWNMRSKIWESKLENGLWKEPGIVSFCREDEFMYDNPFITTDGKKMFFTSTRPGSVSEMKENIWYAERKSTGWSDPRPVSSEVNAILLHWGISVSDTGTLYFGGTAQDNYGKRDIYFSKMENGVYSAPVHLGQGINSNDNEHCPYIAPDESYLIFTRFSDRGQEYYISYHGQSGNWLAPAKIDVGGYEGVCPTVSPDGRYFFFCSDGIYWMTAGFIEKLRPKE
ncbi:MAG: ankyrin repeat domain-containing protein [Bacteroidota bacterium]